MERKPASPDVKLTFLSSCAHFVLDPAETKTSGGAELQVALLARELVKRGHEVTIVGGDHGQEDRRVLQGVKTRVGGRFHTGQLLDTLCALPIVLRQLREERSDFVLILGWTTWLFLLLLVRPLLGYKLVFICGLDSEVNGEFRRENPLRGVLFEYAVKHADVRLAMSRYQERQFHRNHQPCGFYRNLHLPRHEPLREEKSIDFLWVARCQQIKQPHLYLDLVEQLEKSRCCMVCPKEDGELWNSVRARGAKLENLEFHTSVPYHEIQRYYDRASVFVNTSRTEGYPNSFIQAGLGKAAILSLSVDPDEVLRTFAAGICAENDFAALLAAARRIVGSTQVLTEMQRKAQQFVEEWHDNDRNVDLFLDGLERQTAPA